MTHRSRTHKPNTNISHTNQPNTPYTDTNKPHRHPHPRPHPNVLVLLLVCVVCLWVLVLCVWCVVRVVCVSVCLVVCGVDLCVWLLCRCLSVSLRLSPSVCLCLSLSVAVCLCLSLSVSVCRCLSLSVAVCRCLTLSDSVWLCLTLSDSVCLCLSLSVFVCLCLSLSVSVCLCLSLSVSVCLSLSVSLSVSVSVCLRLSMSVSVSVCLCLCLSLSVCPNNFGVLYFSVLWCMCLFFCCVVLRGRDKKKGKGVSEEKTNGTKSLCGGHWSASIELRRRSSGKDGRRATMGARRLVTKEEESQTQEKERKKYIAVLLDELRAWNVGFDWLPRVDTCSRGRPVLKTCLCPSLYLSIFLFVLSFNLSIYFYVQHARVLHVHTEAFLNLHTGDLSLSSPSLFLSSFLFSLPSFSSFVLFSFSFSALFSHVCSLSNNDNDHSSSRLSLCTHGSNLPECQSACTLAYSLFGEHVRIMSETTVLVWFCKPHATWNEVGLHLTWKWVMCLYVQACVTTC